jgi:hypothetical protein
VTTSTRLGLIEDIIISIVVFLVDILRNTDGTVIQADNSGIFRGNSRYQTDFIVENRIEILVTLKFTELLEHLKRMIVKRIEDEVPDEVL